MNSNTKCYLIQTFLLMSQAQLVDEEAKNFSIMIALANVAHSSHTNEKYAYDDD